MTEGFVRLAILSLVIGEMTSDPAVMGLYDPFQNVLWHVPTLAKP
jgi:hypothetical protein